jgi:2-C-methyl-D-erythritol 4-phosphate cytidylyltransferase
VVAGGQGQRFGGKIRKQYLKLAGRPVLWWTLQAFIKSPSVGAIVLVVPPDDRPAIQKQFARLRTTQSFQVVAGGPTRADSVRCGLAALPPEYRWVAVHDGVRPMITPELIEAVYQAARTYGAAIAACPSKDTVKVAAADQTVERTLPRETVWLAHTPQAFERELLERAHGLRRKQSSHRSRTAMHEVTDDAMLIERLGVPVKLVPSPSDNLKVTVPADLEIAQRLMKRRR